MPRVESIARHVESLLHTTVVSTSSVAGGEICAAHRARLADGRTVFVKSRPHPPADFFAAEARGLAWLAAAGPEAAAVPAVLGVSSHCLVLEWVEPGRPTDDAATSLGRALARTHRAGAPSFGAEADGYVGVLPQPNGPLASWADFFAARRLEPYLRLALGKGAIADDDAKAVSAVVDAVDRLVGPAEPPARVHGDLWSGNICWSADSAARLVDPAAYGGHREVDLAMLTLFGAPHLAELLAAYSAEYPLADGWEQRLGLYQIHPLLVHAVHFGGRYGARAGGQARHALAELG